MIRSSSIILLATQLATAATGEIVATGLEAPQRILLTPKGNFLVSESSVKANSGRISMVTRSGQKRPFFEGLPSGATPSGEGTGPTGMALRSQTLYLAIGIGESERRGIAPRTSQHNPDGIASPILSSILRIRLSDPLDSMVGTFRLTPEQQETLADGYPVDLEDGAFGKARVTLLADFPNSIPDPATIYRFSNPWSITLAEEGNLLWVSDASHNALVRVDTQTGSWRRVMRIPAIPNPTGSTALTSEAVPTSVRISGDKVLVSLLTGNPVVPGNARVLSIDPRKRTSTVMVAGLNSVIDFYAKDRADGSRRFFVLEFSRDRAARPPAPGRLLRYGVTGYPEVISDTLTNPVSLAFDSETEDLFVLDLTGRILRFSGK